MSTNLNFLDKMARMRVHHRRLIVVSGLVWLAVGLYLLLKGILLLAEAARQEREILVLISLLKSFAASRQQAVLFLFLCALLVGFFKGRYVLAKTVRRVVGRILSLPSPVLLKKAYSPSYYAIIGCMAFLGVAMRQANIGIDVRGAIDVAVGFALLNGALLYFRKAAALKISHS